MTQIVARPSLQEAFSGGGESGALLRAFEWSQTPLGPPDAWPQPLKTLVGVMLASNQPMFIAWGPERTLLYNDPYVEILAAKHPAAMGQPLLEVWSEIRDDLVPIVEQAYAGQPVHMDDITLFMMRRGFREEAHFAFSYTPVRDETGQVAGFFCPCVETTAQVIAERKLAAEKERQQRLFEQAPGFITVLTGPDHVFEFVNQAYRRMFGERDFVGKTAREAFPELEGQGFHELLDQVYATGERHVAHAAPVRFRSTPDAPEDLRYLDFIYEPITDDDGRVTGIFCEGYDVTEAHLGRTGKLTETQRRFRGIFDSALQFMALLTPDGTVLEVNQTALNWSQIKADDIVGKPFWLAAPMRENPSLQAAIEAAVRRAAAGEIVREEHEMRGAGEVRAIVDFSLKPVLGEGGTTTWLVAEGRDITELKRAQDALRQAQKLEAVGQLTGGVAHDFNNLLTIIRSSTDLLRKPGLAEERRRRYVDAIADTVDRASKLTGQLLAFARRQSLKPEVFDPAQRIRSITDMLRTIVGSRIEIVMEVDCDQCFIEADSSQFETALVNIVVNARDAMDGEGRLTVRVSEEAAMPPIRGHTGGLGRFVAVSLTDTGVGIPEDRLTQIFEPFFTTKEVGKGTGLGLSQVYGFAKQSGGDVAVSSEVERGTTFTLYLPRAAEELAAGMAADPKPSSAIEEGLGRRVLVVEDNIDVGRFATQLLQDLGYETTWASNAGEALKLLAEANLLSEANGFDVVFSDVVMPGMSGIDLGQEIRRRYPGLPVVLTSGYSHVLAEEGRHGFELLQKPYAAEELSRVLRRVTRRLRPQGADAGA